jgi:hypothetical protein
MLIAQSFATAWPQLNYAFATPSVRHSEEPEHWRGSASSSLDNADSRLSIRTIHASWQDASRDSVSLPSDEMLYAWKFKEPLHTNTSFLMCESVAGAGLSAYAYARNSPMLYVDPSGLAPMDGNVTDRQVASRLQAIRDTRQAHYNLNQYNSTLPYHVAAQSWREMSSAESIYHRHGSGTERNEKFISQDGKCEAVYRDGQLVTDAANMWTYNFGPPVNLPGKVEHFVLDVVPYWAWGNSPSDPTPTWNRIKGP